MTTVGAVRCALRMCASERGEEATNVRTMETVEGGRRATQRVSVRGAEDAETAEGAAEEVARRSRR